MADGEIKYEIRSDDSHIEDDLKKTGQKIEKGTSKWIEYAKKAGKAIGGAAVEAGSSAFKFGTEFETSMAEVSLLFGDTKVNMDDFQKRILELSNSSGIAAAELSKSLGNALLSGVPKTDDMSDAINILDKSLQLAKVGFSDVDTVVASTMSVLNDYGAGIEETDRLQNLLMQTQNNGRTTVDELCNSINEVTPTAAQMGVGFDQVATSIAMMTKQQIPASTAASKLNDLLSALGSTGSVTEKVFAAATENTQYAGKSFQELMQSGVPLCEILDLMNAYAKENQLEMDTVYKSLDNLNTVYALSDTNASEFTDTLASMNEETNAVGEAFDKVSGTTGEGFNNVMNRLHNTFVALFEKMEPLISAVLPVLDTLIQSLLPPLMELADAILGPLGEVINQLTVPITELVNTLLPVLTELFTIILGPLSELISGLLPPLIDFLNQLLPPLMEIISSIMPILISLFDALFPPLMKLIGDILPVVADILLALIEPLVDILNVILPPLLRIIEAILPPIIDIIEAIEPLIVILGELIKNFLEPLMPVITILADLFANSLSIAIDNVFAVISPLIDAFKEILNFIKCIFIGDWKGAWESVKNIFSDIWEGIKNYMKMPINWIIDGINFFIKALNKLKIPDWVPVVGGKGIDIPLIPRLKKGMSFVPSDFFPAYLDYGERVLTADQNARFMSMGGLQGMNLALSGKLSNFGSGKTITIITPVEVDGREIARATAVYCSEQMSWEGI